MKNIKIFSIAKSVCIAVFLLSALNAWAVSPEAQRHYDRAQAATEIAASSGDYMPAILEYKEALALAPNWADAYYNLGLVQQKAKDFKGAVFSFRKYLQLFPHAPNALAVRSLINKAEYMAEQTLSSEDIYHIFTSLTDTNRWKIKAIDDGLHFRRDNWLKSIFQVNKPGVQDRLFISS